MVKRRTSRASKAYHAQAKARKVYLRLRRESEAERARLAAFDVRKGTKA
jgi:hypothetical protein